MRQQRHNYVQPTLAAIGEQLSGWEKCWEAAFSLLTTFVCLTLTSRMFITLY